LKKEECAELWSRPGRKWNDFFFALFLEKSIWGCGGGLSLGEISPEKLTPFREKRQPPTQCLRTELFNLVANKQSGRTFEVEREQ
jgi:hypothetical protein